MRHLPPLVARRARFAVLAVLTEFAVLAVLAVLGGLSPSAAHAAPVERGDGAYGRLAGDVALVGGVGAGLVAASGRPLLTTDLRARYLDAAGIALSYEEGNALGAARVGELRRGVLAGVELRPLFPVRFLKGAESGRRFVDLTLDSLALDMGVLWAWREGSGARRPGLYAGLAVEAPLAGAANGPWLRLSASLRWAAPRLEGEDDPSGRAVVVGLGLAWHQMVATGLAARGDLAPR